MKNSQAAAAYPSKFKYEPFDPKYLTHMHDTCMSLSEYRKKNPVNKMDELYYHNIAQYYRHYRDADKNGRKRVVHSVMMPAEIIYALGMEPYQIEPGGGAVVSRTAVILPSSSVLLLPAVASTVPGRFRGTFTTSTFSGTRYFFATRKRSSAVTVRTC